MLADSDLTAAPPALRAASGATLGASDSPAQAHPDGRRPGRRSSDAATVLLALNQLVEHPAAPANPARHRRETGRRRAGVCVCRSAFATGIGDEAHPGARCPDARYVGNLHRASACPPRNFSHRWAWTRNSTPSICVSKRRSARTTCKAWFCQMFPEVAQCLAKNQRIPANH